MAGLNGSARIINYYNIGLNGKFKKSNFEKLQVQPYRLKVGQGIWKVRTEIRKSGKTCSM
jgi:hypothetical protein